MEILPWFTIARGGVRFDLRDVACSPRSYGGYSWQEGWQRSYIWPALQVNAVGELRAVISRIYIYNVPEAIIEAANNPDAVDTVKLVKELVVSEESATNKVVCSGLSINESLQELENALKRRRIYRLLDGQHPCISPEDIFKGIQVQQNTLDRLKKEMKEIDN